MVKTLDIMAELSEDREIRLILPEDFPVGRVSVHIASISENDAEASTFGDLLHSEFFGMWKDRTDITDTDTFAAELRQKAWTRQP